MNKTFFILSMLLVLAATTVQAQFTYITTNGTITITGYTGSGGDVTIPAATYGCQSLVSEVLLSEKTCLFRTDNHFY